MERHSPSVDFNLSHRTFVRLHSRSYSCSSSCRFFMKVLRESFDHLAQNDAPDTESRNCKVSKSWSKESWSSSRCVDLLVVLTESVFEMSVEMSTVETVSLSFGNKEEKSSSEDMFFFVWFLVCLLQIWFPVRLLVCWPFSRSSFCRRKLLSRKSFLSVCFQVCFQLCYRHLLVLLHTIIIMMFVVEKRVQCISIEMWCRSATRVLKRSLNMHKKSQVSPVL